MENLSNKHSFIQFFENTLEWSVHNMVIYARQDADVDIVVAAIVLPEQPNVKDVVLSFIQPSKRGVYIE